MANLPLNNKDFYAGDNKAFDPVSKSLDVVNEALKESEKYVSSLKDELEKLQQQIDDMKQEE